MKKKDQANLRDSIIKFLKKNYKQNQLKVFLFSYDSRIILFKVSYKCND